MKNDFRFIGKNSAVCNAALEHYIEMANNCKLKFGYSQDGLGNRYNALVYKNAKPNKRGFYNQSDVLGNWSDAQQCTTFLMGYARAKSKV